LVKSFSKRRRIVVRQGCLQWQDIPLSLTPHREKIFRIRPFRPSGVEKNDVYAACIPKCAQGGRLAKM
jgi:hypothetical protein